MKIGIDIDGVLNNQHDFCLEYGTKFCLKLGKYKLENPSALNTRDMFLWDDDTAHKFWDEHRKYLTMILPSKQFASEVIAKLKEENNEIYIITARRNNDEWFSKTLKNKAEEITKEWLQDNDIQYDEIFFDVQNKGNFCKNNNINMMIGDDPINLRTLIGNTNVFVYDCPYNRDKEFQKLTRVYSWYDIYHKIKSKINNN